MYKIYLLTLSVSFYYTIHLFRTFSPPLINLPTLYSIIYRLRMKNYLNNIYLFHYMITHLYPSLLVFSYQHHVSYLQITHQSFCFTPARSKFLYYECCTPFLKLFVHFCHPISQKSNIIYKYHATWCQYSVSSPTLFTLVFAPSCIIFSITFISILCTLLFSFGTWGIFFTLFIL